MAKPRLCQEFQDRQGQGGVAILMTSGQTQAQTVPVFFQSMIIERPTAPPLSLKVNAALI